ncbi:MAG: thioredoxin family protein [Gemmatimonadales bacterium]
MRLPSRGAVLALVLLLALGGKRLYLNLRPNAPLPEGFVEYTAETWRGLEAAGGPLLVEVYASWCPTCEVQHRALDGMLRDPRYQAVTGVRVDFDRDADFLRAHRITRQSTLLVFAGGMEVSRTVALTSADAIGRQLDAALSGASVP